MPACRKGLKVSSDEGTGQMRHHEKHRTDRIGWLRAAVGSPQNLIPIIVSVTSLGFLALLGGVSARAGGAPVWKAVARVTFRGALAMAATAGIGAIFGVSE